MPGGHLQLLAYNESNKFLSGNPQITFFKSIYKKYTNFSIQTIQQDLIGLGNLTNGSIKECTINNHNIDLLHDMYLYVDLDLTLNDNILGENTNNNNIINFGHNIIDYIELSIGGLLIDKHYGKWLQIRHELFEKNDLGYHGLNCEDSDHKFSNLFTKSQTMSGIGIHKIGSYSNESINTDTTNNSESYYGANYRKYGSSNTFLISGSSSTNLKGKLIIPLYFWFCNKPGLALPLLSILYDDINIKIKFNKSLVSSEITTETPTIKNFGSGKFINNLGFNTDNSILVSNDNSHYSLYCDYIFLDEEERNKFLLSNHQYLIEQIQYQENILPSPSTSISNLIIDLKFNHCIKELIWVFQKDTPLYETEFINIQNFNGSIQLLMNKFSRFEEQNILYFTRYQPYLYHLGRGGVNSVDSIFMYSFSLFPDKYQPSGICNFSEIETQMELNDITFSETINSIKCYAINYNILKISGGSVKLLFGK